MYAKLRSGWPQKEPLRDLKCNAMTPPCAATEGDRDQARRPAEPPVRAGEAGADGGRRQRGHGPDDPASRHAGIAASVGELGPGVGGAVDAADADTGDQLRGEQTHLDAHAIRIGIADR
jgi:hypothetical protein